MEVNSKKVVREVLDEIQKRDGATFKKEEKRGCTRFPFTYSLPIDDSSKLVIFCNRNKNLNKKGTKHKPWTLWFFVEKINEMTIEDYKKFLDKIINWRIIATYPVCINTKNHVKKLIDEFKSRDGVTSRNLKNKGCSAFPNTYSCPIDKSTKHVVMFCEKKKDFNPKDPAKQQWVLRHCIVKP